MAISLASDVSFDSEEGDCVTLTPLRRGRIGVSTIDSVGDGAYMCITPEEARDLATKLHAVANIVDGKE